MRQASVKYRPMAVDIIGDMPVMSDGISKIRYRRYGHSESIGYRRSGIADITDQSPCQSRYRYRYIYIYRGFNFQRTRALGILRSMRVNSFRWFLPSIGRALCALARSRPALPPPAPSPATQSIAIGVKTGVTSIETSPIPDLIYRTASGDAGVSGKHCRTAGPHRIQ